MVSALGEKDFYNIKWKLFRQTTQWKNHGTFWIITTSTNWLHCPLGLRLPLLNKSIINCLDVPLIFTSTKHLPIQRFLIIANTLWLQSHLNLGHCQQNPVLELCVYKSSKRENPPERDFLWRRVPIGFWLNIMIQSPVRIRTRSLDTLLLIWYPFVWRKDWTYILPHWVSPTHKYTIRKQKKSFCEPQH